MQFVYCILYLLFICCGFLFGQLYIPGSPLNNLQILTLLMLAICVKIDRKPQCDKYLFLYFCFIILYFVFELLLGYLSRLIAFFRTYIFIGYVFYWATKILVQKYNTLWPLVITATIIGVFDSIITGFQALGIPITNSLVNSLILDNSFNEYMESHSDGMGVAVSGLYYSPVLNGHNLLFFYFLSLLCCQKYKKWFLFIPSVIILVGLFFCQQRSPFYIAVFMSFILYVKRVSLSPVKTFFMLITLSIIIIYVLPVFIDYVDSSGSRMLSSDDTNRFNIWEKGIVYFLEHPFVCSYHDFVIEKKSYPHNLLLSVLVSGGLLGFYFISRMLYLQLKFMIAKYKLYKSHIGILIISFSYLGLVLDSMSHNTGWVDGDYATFICWSLCYYSLTFYSSDDYARIHEP